jgi:hypothetical protein
VRARTARRLGLLAFLAVAVVVSPASAPASHEGPLVAQWHLDELIGDPISTSPDSSGHGLDLVEGPSDGGLEGTAGRFGLGVLFDANTPLVLGQSTLLEPQRVSVVAWVRSGGSPGVNRAIVAKGGDSMCGASSWALGTASGGLEFYVRGPGSDERFSSPFAFAGDVWDAEWHAVAGTYDGTTVRLYVDGAEVGSGQPGPSAIDYGRPDRSFALGQYPSCAGRGISERLDEVQVYNRALTPAEVATLHDPSATAPRVIGPDENPPPPTGSAPRNVTPPAIRPGIRNGLYVCEEGTWEGADEGFEYRWYRIPSLGRAGRRLVATTYGYTLPAANRGARFVCEVIARNSFGSTSAASPVTILTGQSSQPYLELERSAFGNFRIRGIDVFQVVQPSSAAGAFGFPTGAFVDYGTDAGGGTPTNFRGPFDVLLPGLSAQRVSYDGVPLDAGKPATAVVYANMSDGPPKSTTQPVEVTLRFKVGGRVLAEQTQTVRNLPVTGRRVVTAAQRDDPASGIQFAVPGWVLQTAAPNALELEAEVRLPVVAAVRGLQECLSSGCGADNRFRLVGAPVFRAPRVGVVALQLLGRNQASLPTPDRVLASARRLWPGGESMSVPSGYGASLDVGDEQNFSYADHECEDDVDLGSVRRCRQYYIEQRIFNWLSENPLQASAGQLLFAGHDYFVDERDGSRFSEPGFAPRGVDLSSWRPGDRPAVFTASTRADRIAQYSPAHELGHALSAPHAGTGCGANANGQVGEQWPPDQNGRLQGTAFDPSDIALSGRIDPHVDTDADALFDLMSYCRNADHIDTWLSARNWNRATSAMVDLRLRLGGASAAQAPAASRRGFAVGVVGESRGSITRVAAPDGNDRVPAPDPGSPVLLRSLSGSGATLLEAGVTVVGNSEGGPGGAFAGPVAAGAAAVELVRAGTVLDRVERSRRPSLRLLSPRARARARRGLVVRWRARDPEGAPLQATVDFSRDGRTWATVFQGPSRGRARLPRSVLPASRRARVRVTVNDGFTERTATSGRFRTAGSPPVPRIERPAAPERLTAGARVLLAGTALDDRLRNLRGRSLTWFAGRRRLGHGERLTVRLPAGAVTLRLVARDSLGRTGSARRRVRVRPAPLRLLALEAPPHVRRGARSVALAVRVSAPATLRAGGRRVRLGTAATRVRLPLPARPKRGLLRLSYVVRARGGDARGTIKGGLVVLR